MQYCFGMGWAKKGIGVELAILGILAVLAIPVGLIVALVSLSDVKRRLDGVQKRLTAAEDRLAAMEA
ncbi:MAG: hypothetical protein RLZZ563_1536, partial [Pseudomonadota bacterium]